MKNTNKIELAGNTFVISKNSDAIRHEIQGGSLNEDELTELKNFAETHSIEFIVPFGKRYKTDKCLVLSFIGDAKLEYLEDIKKNTRKVA